MRTEVRLVAFGGQGIVLAGVILGEAAVAGGKNAVQTQSYGPESRGGAAKSEVVISDEEIDYPMVLAADCLVALSQPGYDRYRVEIKPRAAVIVDEDLVAPDAPPASGVLYRLPFAKTADRLGNRVVMNVVVLGSVCSVTGVVSRENMAKAVTSNVPGKYLELNLQAFDEGYRMGEQALEQKNPSGR